MHPFNRCSDRCGVPKKGFTLVEMVVALAISAILFTAMFAILSPLYGIYQRVTARADAQLIAGNVLDVLRRNAAKAQTVLALPDEDSGMDQIEIGADTYFLLNDQLVYASKRAENPDAKIPVFADSYYNGKKITLDVSQLEENMAEVYVGVYNDDLVLAEATTVLSPLANIVAEYESDTAAGQYALALAEIQSYTGGGGAGGIEIAIKQKNGDRWPEFDVKTLIAYERLTALALKAANAGHTALAAYYTTLASPNTTFYLATYVVTAAGDKFVPIVYLTTNGDASYDDPGQAYLVYFHGVWYARTAENADPVGTIPQLDVNGKTEKEIGKIFFDNDPDLPDNWTSLRLLEK